MSSPLPSPRPRVALIGVTGYAGIYVEMLRPFVKQGEIELVAAVVINRGDPAAAAAGVELASWGARIYDSNEAFFAGETGRAELCLIPTGIAWHARLTIAALRAGMHVLVEKPLAGSRVDAAAIRRAELATGRWVAVGFQDIYSEAAEQLRSELAFGVLGPVTAVAAFGLWPRPVAYYTRNHWAGRLRADGADVLDSPLNNAFAHFVNLALYFADWNGENEKPTTFREAELWRANSIETFDTAVVRGRLGNGVRFWFGFSHATEDLHDPEIVITGTRGEVRWQHEKHYELVTDTGEFKRVSMPDAFACRHRMLQAVLERLRRPGAPICDTRVAARHTAFICDLHAVAQARDVPAHLVESDPVSDGSAARLTVSGLGAAMRRAFDGRGTLAATGVFSGEGPAVATSEVGSRLRE